MSLKQEGISYCAGARVPAVIVNVMRGGPGLGNIQASQGDYFQGVKGGGNGDYHLLTYAPSSIQEFIDIMMFAYEKAEKYRIPVLFLADGIIAQMMEPVELPEMVDYKVDPEKKPWACTGWKPGDDPAKRGVINSIYIDTESLAVHNDELQAVYKEVVANEQMVETYNCEGAEYIITAFGTVARIAKSAIAELKAKGALLCDCAACTLAADILSKKEYLAKKSMWIFGGDGWAYDIGYGGLDHVIASKKDVNIFVFDTEVYSNTGGQASKSSNIGQVAQFAAAGKETKKKSLAEIAMSYGYVYVAQVAMGANPAQTLKAIQEAEAYHGPSLIIGYAPCEMHSIKGGMTNCQAEMKKAVECGYWNLFRFNPAAETDKFIVDSKEPKEEGYRAFLMNEARYSRLTREFPDRAETLFKRNEEVAMDRYQHLLKLKAMYDEK